MSPARLGALCPAEAYVRASRTTSLDDTSLKRPPWTSNVAMVSSSLRRAWIPRSGTLAKGTAMRARASPLRSSTLAKAERSRARHARFPRRSRRRWAPGALAQARASSCGRHQARTRRAGAPTRAVRRLHSRSSRASAKACPRAPGRSGTRARREFGEACQSDQRGREVHSARAPAAGPPAAAAPRAPRAPRAASRAAHNAGVGAR
eukprot:scaffold30891_cov30-Tisochrysis_lutea.AAC.3